MQKIQQESQLQKKREQAAADAAASGVESKVPAVIGAAAGAGGAAPVPPPTATEVESNRPPVPEVIPSWRCVTRCVQCVHVYMFALYTYIHTHFS